MDAEGLDDLGDILALTEQDVGLTPRRICADARGSEVSPRRLLEDELVENGGAIGVTCHGARILIGTGLLRSRSLTSYPTPLTDLENAGARCVDEEVRDDDGLVSSRRPRDLPAFTARIIEEFAKDRRPRTAF